MHRKSFPVNGTYVLCTTMKVFPLEGFALYGIMIMRQHYFDNIKIIMISLIIAQHQLVQARSQGGFGGFDRTPF